MVLMLASGYAGVAQLVELQFSKLNVVSSSLIARSKIEFMWIKKSFLRKRPCGSVVEHSLGKGEVAGPIPAMGTKKCVKKSCEIIFKVNINIIFNNSLQVKV